MDQRRGAAFDVDLEYKVGQAIGDEMLASGNTMMLAPTVNTLRHPAWGRSQETYGEDSFTLGRLGSAFGYVFDHATPIGEIVLASPTYHRITAEFHGRAAHAGIRPENGRSAIAAAAAGIAAMRLGRVDETTTANRSGDSDKPLLPLPLPATTTAPPINVPVPVPGLPKVQLPPLLPGMPGLSLGN